MSTGFIRKLEPPHSFPFLTNTKAQLGKPTPFSILPAPAGIPPPILTTASSTQTFRVKSLANCILWLDMNDTTTLYDNSTKLKDKSDKQYTVVHSVGSFLPITLNGLTYLDISVEAGNFIQVPGFTLRPTFTAVFVIWGGNSDIFWYLDLVNNPLDGPSMFLQTQSNQMMYVPLGPLFRDVNYAQIYPFSFAPTPNQFYIFIGGYNLETVMNPYRVNGTVRQSEVSPDSAVQFTTNNTPITDTLRITGWGPNGYLAEFAFFDRSLTTQECEKLEGYLAQKWNLQSVLPSSHPYKTKGPQML